MLLARARTPHSQTRFLLWRCSRKPQMALMRVSSSGGVSALPTPCRFLSLREPSQSGSAAQFAGVSRKPRTSRGCVRQCPQTDTLVVIQHPALVCSAGVERRSTNPLSFGGADRLRLASSCSHRRPFEWPPRLSPSNNGQLLGSRPRRDGFLRYVRATPCRALPASRDQGEPDAVGAG